MNTWPAVTVLKIFISKFKPLIFSPIYFAVGILTILKFAYPRTVEEPDVYDSIRVHAEGGTPDKTEVPTFAVSQLIAVENKS